MSWTLITLDELTSKVDYGLSVSAKPIGTGPRFLRITDLQDDSVDWASVPSCECTDKEKAQNLLKKGDIVFARTGATTGKSYLLTDITEETVFASYLIRVRPNDKVDPLYLSYFFRSPKYWQQILVMANGAAQPGVNSTKLKGLEIPLPYPDDPEKSLKEQKRIAAILDKADGIRRKRQQAIQLADDFLTAAYIERFGDPSKSSYEILELKKVTKKITDGAHFTPTYTESGIPFLRVTDISKGVLDWDKTKFIPKSEHEELIKRCNPEKGDVLYSKNGTIGVPRLIDWDKEFSIFVSLCLIKPDERYLRGKYLESFLKTPFALKQAKAKSKSATVTNLHLVEIKEIKLPIPPLKIQDEWVRFLDRYNTLLNKMKNSELNPDHSFNSLSQKAFKGEL